MESICVYDALRSFVRYGKGRPLNLNGRGMNNFGKKLEDFLHLPICSWFSDEGGWDIRIGS